MSLAIVVEMNLSPDWALLLGTHGHAAAHWSSVGSAGAPDAAIMAWASANGHVILTHDLGFGRLLATTHATGPSVVLVRGNAPAPQTFGPIVVQAIAQYEAELRAGALVVVDATRQRVRVLPI
ncbi:MAG: DUF5615 family PIN-like protein [Gemmataceae bacterium]|nr:DUF5615 family PIN-like protein [Gemmataceae bacterium]